MTMVKSRLGRQEMESGTPPKPKAQALNQQNLGRSISAELFKRSLNMFHLFEEAVSLPEVVSMVRMLRQTKSRKRYPIKKNPHQEENLKDCSQPYLAMMRKTWI